MCTRLWQWNNQVPRVVGDEFNVVLLHGMQRDGVLERTVNGATVDPNNLECVAMQVHRVIFHAHVGKAKSNTLSDFDINRLGIRIAAAIDGPGI